MKIEIDKNNLLTIFNEKIPQTKEYTYHVSGYTFSDFDKGIIVLHKKEWKIISLKNLGDNMSVVYMKNEKITSKSNKKGMNEALKLFQGFDEETGKKYYFIPGMGEVQQQEKNIILKKLGTSYIIQKTAKGMMIEGIESENSLEDTLGYLFGLMVIYGKWEGKNILNRQKNQGNEVFLDDGVIPTTGETLSTNLSAKADEMKGLKISKVVVYKELSSIKIQIPLSGQHLIHEETLDAKIKKLQQEGIFLKIDKLANKNGIIYQISSNDYELLETFAKWYEAVEKFEKITKREFTEEMKTKLIEFVSTNPEIPQDGKIEIIKQLKEGTIKLLTK